MESKPITVGSLFSGIGGFELGFQMAGGFDIRWQVEKDDWCRRVLAKHWPDVKRYEDITTLDAGELEKVDLICGGFPCQEISNAGCGIGLQGPRSGLWSDFARLVCTIRPRFVIVENVRALLVRGLDEVLRDFVKIGYDARWATIPASAFGCPSWQENVFVIAYPAGERRAEPWDDKPHTVYGRQDGKWETTDAINAIRRGAMPGVCRSHRRVSNRVDRLRGLGDAVVPQVVEWIANRIKEAV